MKILMISTDFPYKTGDSKHGTIIQGGGSACIAQLVEGLLKHNIDVAVVTRAEKHISRELYDIPICRTRFAYLGFRESKITHTLFALPAAARMVRSFKPDIIHSHNPPAALAGAVCAKLFNKPHVLTMHGPWSEVRISSIKKMLAGHIERAALKSADAITCDSTALKHQLEHKYHIEAAGIQNAVDRRYYSKMPKQKARALLGIRTKNRIVLFTGRFVAEKGLDALLQAASILLGRRDDITFLFIGGGFDEKIVHSWLARKPEYRKRILAIPFLRHELMRHAYSASDVFVLPSLAEGLSRSLMEAMLFGLPCIATAVGGNIELLENGRGLLVSPRDSRVIAGSIEKILDNGRLARRLAGNARAHVINNLTVEKRISKFIQVYKDLVVNNCGLKAAALV